MKRIYYTLLAWIVVMSMGGCQEPDALNLTLHPENTEPVVSGILYSDGATGTKYPSIVDLANGRITIRVPYYLSDTDPIRGDLTRMKLEASIPKGAKFVPSIEGVHDLTQPFKSTLHYYDGKTQEFTFTAEYQKSGDAKLLSFAVPGVSKLNYSQATKDGHMVIRIVRTGSALLSQLKNTPIEVKTSPWSTTDVKEGALYDLTDPNTKITVTAQDGTKVVYTFEMVNPTLVGPGKYGICYPLFGKYFRVNDGSGWTVHNNRTMGVVGDELVVSNLKSALLRYNRYTGEKLPKEVNMTNTNLDNMLAITHDEGGHLVGVDMASIANKWIPNRQLKIYLWKDGLDAPASVIMNLNMLQAPEYRGITSDSGIGRSIAVNGDLTKGRAQVGLFLAGVGKAIIYHFQNGKNVGNTGLFGPTGLSDHFQTPNKVFPMTNEDDTDVLIGMTQERTLVRVKQDGSFFVLQPAQSWWDSPKNTKTFAYRKFNEMDLVVIINGYLEGGIDAYNKMTVSDVSSWKPNALTTGLIIDSRNKNIDPNVEGEFNYTPTGFLSLFTGNQFTDNSNRTADACFGVNDNGTAVQAYILNTNQGIMGYEITLYDM